MTRSIAVLSFLPDVGHVMPLLRLAAAFADRGHPIVCYLPDECARIVKPYRFPFISLGPALSDELRATYDRVLLKLSAKSIFYNAFSAYRDLSICYLDPLVSKVSRQVQSLNGKLSGERTLFVLADDHVFRPLYVGISKALAVPLVINTSEGYRAYQSRFVQFYGITDLPRSMQALIERLGTASELIFRLLRKVRQTTQEEKRQIVAVQALRKSESDGELTITVATGYNGYLERKYLGSLLTIPASPPAFAPTCHISPHCLDPKIRHWIERDNSTVVYVSFGSMVSLERKFVQAVLNGLAIASVRVLWSMPKRQQESLLPVLQIPAGVCFVDFVQPLEVLSFPNVRCGINHAGCGSIQDCLVTGRPMLCIPFMWDQPFNGSVIAHLGVGKRLLRRQVSDRAIARAVQSILADTPLLHRAEELSNDLNNLKHQADVVNFILSQPQIKRREFSQ